MNKCFGTTSFNNNIFFKNETKISVIIPIFNCENSIKFSVSSIQNQRLKEIEIILVNDFSEDKSKYIIENLRMHDKRIILINNNKNMGTLYSRNIGALLARGKYIFALDHDDMFLDDHIIYKMYKIAEMKDYDIIGFKTLYLNKGNYYDEPYITNKNDKVTMQPKLKFLSFSNKDCHIWAKCIKKEIYKKAISLMGVKRSTTYLCYGEDDVIVYMLFSTAKIFRFIPVYGLLHFVSEQTASFKLSEKHKLFSKIFFLELVFELTDNNFMEKKYVFLAAKSIKLYIEQKNLNFDETNKNYLKKVIKKIINCNYISVENKEFITKLIY